MNSFGGVNVVSTHNIFFGEGVEGGGDQVTLFSDLWGSSGLDAARSLMMDSTSYSSVQSAQRCTSRCYRFIGLFTPTNVRRQ